MKKILLGLAISVMTLLSSCGGAPSEAKFSELSKDSDGKIYYGNTLFSGTATSEDGVFLQMKIDNGEIKHIEAKHNNGVVAMSTIDGGFSYFNEAGEQVSNYEYIINYFDIQNKVDECLSEITSK